MISARAGEANEYESWTSRKDYDFKRKRKPGSQMCLLFAVQLSICEKVSRKILLRDLFREETCLYVLTCLTSRSFQRTRRRKRFTHFFFSPLVAHAYGDRSFVRALHGLRAERESAIVAKRNVVSCCGRPPLNARSEFALRLSARS